MNGTAKEALTKYFGFSSFRPKQEEIVKAALAGRNVLAVLPTGAGKSLCFQLPALMTEGLTLICSPLIALMKDQVDQLRKIGISAACLNQTIDAEESRSIMRDLLSSELKLLYTSPERLVMDGFVEFLKKIPIARIVVDEAHCISEWGHDFRPEFRGLKKLKEAFPKAPWMAVTATATKPVREDIIETLELSDPEVIVASFNRPNLFYKVQAKKDAKFALLDFVNNRRGQSGIVYCLARDGCEAIAELLQKAGHKACAYHAGLETDLRTKTQDRFLSGEVDLVCATIAFGMGVNKSNVRFVVHYDLPKSLASYYQETGRAGRDGEPAECLLFFGVGDAHKVRYFFDQISEENQKEIARKQLQAVISYAQTNSCRRQALLQYFNEQFEGGCEHCDNCKCEQTAQYNTEAMNFLACVHRLQKSLLTGFGLNHVINVLTATPSDSVSRWNHDKNKSWGVGAAFPKDFWFQIGRALIASGYVTQDQSKYSTLTLSDSGERAIKERTVLMLRISPDVPASVQPAPKRAKAITKKTNDLAFSRELFEELKQLRRSLADTKGVPAFVIFSDATLKDLASKKPQSKAEFLQVNGVGEVKHRQYGEAFMGAIRKFELTGQ